MLRSIYAWFDAHPLIPVALTLILGYGGVTAIVYGALWQEYWFGPLGGAAVTSALFRLYLNR